MPRRPRVRSSKLKVIVVWLFSVEKRSERRRGGEGEGFCNFFLSSPRLLGGKDAAVVWGI